MSYAPTAVLALALALSGTAGAATIVEWSLEGAPGNQATTAGQTALTGVVAGDLARGAGLNATGAANSFSSSGWTGQATDYYSFGFSLDAGTTVDLESLYIGTRSSGTGPGVVGLYWSGDNYLNSLTVFTQGSGTFLNSVVDLSSLPELSGNVEFRLVQFGTTSAGGGTTASGGTFRTTGYFTPAGFDRNMQITGTVSVVPEPGTIALLLAGLATVGFVARRRG